MEHHSDSYKLYLRAQGMTEACNSLYHAMSRSSLYHAMSRRESASYHLKDIQEYLHMTQIMLDSLKGEIK